MNKFGGIDLNTNNSVIVVSDDADWIVYQRRLSNDPVQIRASLASHFEGRVGGHAHAGIRRTPVS
jgi:transposase